jgi:hypothetical protein
MDDQKKRCQAAPVCLKLRHLRAKVLGRRTDHRRQLAVDGYLNGYAAVEIAPNSPASR